MHITCGFDSGNIKVIEAKSEQQIRLEINRDAHSDFYQWFHFRLTGKPGVTHRCHIEKLDQSAYPLGWQDYHVVASYDCKNWFRVPSQYADGTLSFELQLAHASVFFAYFTPYSSDRHLRLLHQSQCHPRCQLKQLGLTHDGRDIAMLTIGEPTPEKKAVWVTARQHPGETMAEWCAEGLIQRLLNDNDGVAQALLAEAVFYVVPNMNPDGSARGHLRTNALGINLNREWATPSLEQSPEVFHVLHEMQTTGVDIFLDLHGDEALPYNFVAGCEGIPNYTEKLASLESLFKQTLISATPEFQDVYGYPKDQPGKANLSIANNAVANRFGCLSFTLEMPFKDNADLPNTKTGWSAPRSHQLGEDLLIAIRAVLCNLN